MKKDWYDEAFKILNDKLSEKRNVSGVEFLSEFFIYHSIDELQGGDEVSADDYARDEVEEFESWLREYKGKSLVVGKRYSWRCIDGDAGTLEGRREDDFEEEMFDEKEKLLLNMNLASIRLQHYQDFSSLYEKVFSLNGRDLVANVALRVATALDLTGADYEEKIEKWKECGAKEDDAGKSSCYKRYSKAASIAALNLDHLRSARLYEDAMSSYKKYRENFKTHIDIIRRARRQYNILGYDEDASRLYVEENDVLLSNLCWWRCLPLRAYKWVSNYGESPGRVLYRALWVIIICTFIYSFQGIYSSGNYRNGMPCENPESNAVVQIGASVWNLESFWEPLGIGLYYSVVTFTTLGYGDFSPAGTSVRVVSAIQALLGLILTSLFMVTVVRKYSR